jgi:hypothetical protein
LSNWYEVLIAESYKTTERTWKNELGTKLTNWIKIETQNERISQPSKENVRRKI